MTIRIAVVGGGHLGSIHAGLLQQVDDAELVAVVEPSQTRAAQLRDKFRCETVTDVERFIASADIDGAVVAVPTSLHHDIGIALLDRGIHVLMEKPLATTPAECTALVNAAREQNCVLQVGHVERFNPVWSVAQRQMQEPRFIDATREGPLTFRSMDAGVVLDLMIHDIDLILSLVRSRTVGVQALGFNWTGPAEDIAQARLTFENGCVATLAASRVSCQPRRQMRVYGRNWFAEVDFANRSCYVVDGPETNDWQSKVYSDAERRLLAENTFDRVLRKRDLVVPEANPILEELRDFVTSIQTQTTPRVSAVDGMTAVDIACQIVERFESHAPVSVFRPSVRRAG